jgi:outer membrane protein TolC
MLEQEAVVIQGAARRDLARAELAAVLQVEETELTPGDDPVTRPPPLPPLHLLLAEAERARPDLQAAQAELQVQHEEVTVAQGALWPQVSLFGRADAENEILGIPQERPIASFAGGVAVRWEIFDSLSTYQAIRKTWPWPRPPWMPVAAPCDPCAVKSATIVR